MSKFSILLPAAIAITVLSVPTATYAISASFSTPASGQSFKAGVGISYQGSGSWSKTTERPLGSVGIDLVWYDPNNLNGLGTVVDSDYPTTTVETDPNTGVETGNFSFTNSVVNGTSGLIAETYNGNPKQYYIRACPASFKGAYRDPNKGGIYYAYATLGSIS